MKHILYQSIFETKQQADKILSDSNIKRQKIILILRIK